MPAVRASLAAVVRKEDIIRPLLCQELSDRFQFPPMLRGGPGICHLKFIQRIDDNSGHNQPGIFLIIGGNDIPRCMTGACRMQASLIGFCVTLPVFSLVNVRETEFPVFVRLINALEEALSLLVLREM